jgi:hypothetical protein
MKKKNLAAWKFLNFLKKEKTEKTTANIWHKIFLEIKEELTRDAGCNLGDFYKQMNDHFSDSELELGNTKITTLILEAYNRYLVSVDQKVNANIAKIKFLSKNRKICSEKKSKDASTISEIIKTINHEMLVRNITRTELEVTISKIAILKMQET